MEEQTPSIEEMLFMVLILMKIIMEKKVHIYCIMSLVIVDSYMVY